jgi:chemosensory pili system protein ChpE
MDIVFGAMLGVVYILSPGPVIVETVRRGVRSGFRGALLLQVGALAADLILASLALYGVTRFIGNPTFQFVLSITGMGLLFGLGIISLRQCWGSSLRKTQESSAEAGRKVVAQTSSTHFVIGLGLAFANPYGLLFWMSIENTILHQASSYLVHFLLGFFVAGLVVSIVIAKLVCVSSRWLTPGMSRLTAFTLGVVMIGMGLNLGYAAIIYP